VSAQIPQSDALHEHLLGVALSGPSVAQLDAEACTTMATPLERDRDLLCGSHPTIAAE
jgi:hypothetical protein